MQTRIAAWEKHYPWVNRDSLDYFRTRVTRARRDGIEALAWVEKHATSRELQDKCVAALVTKTEILWAMLDAIEHG
jgi:pyrroloquinoline-quinone synthase